MSIFAGLVVLLVAFVAMEGLAWAMHKYVMHGWLWVLHRDHHQPHQGRFERNDWFALMFAVPSAALILHGAPQGRIVTFWIGLGIAAYGLAYFLLHDVLVHRRLPIAWPPRHPYLRRLVRAHQVHHAKATKDGGESFGFLWAPKRYGERRG